MKKKTRKNWKNETIQSSRTKKKNSRQKEKKEISHSNRIYDTEWTDGRLNRRTHACMYWLNDATRRALLPPKTVIEKCLTVDIQQTDYIFEEYVGKYVMKMECENKNGLTIISNNRQYKIIKRMAGHSNNVKIWNHTAKPQFGCSLSGKGRTDRRLFKFEGWTEAALKACK